MYLKHWSGLTKITQTIQLVILLTCLRPTTTWTIGPQKEWFTSQTLFWGGKAEEGVEGRGERNLPVSNEGEKGINSLQWGCRILTNRRGLSGTQEEIHLGVRPRQWEHMRLGPQCALSTTNAPVGKKGRSSPCSRQTQSTKAVSNTY